MKRNYDIWVAVVLVVLITVVLVAYDVSLDNRVYAENDAEKIIEVRAGDSFFINLEENPSTGFNWQWAADRDDIITLESDQFKEPKAEGLVGAPGTHEFKFMAVKTGDAVVKFDYSQPWEPESVEKTFVYSIKVIN
jgi:predicted secreted protein